MKPFRAAAVLALGIALTLPASAAPATHATSPASAAPAIPAGIPALKDVPMTMSTPYDPQALSQAAVNAALARARSSHRRVLIELGSNWCPDCLALANVLRVPVIERFVKQHFEVVVVDVGRFDLNQDIPARFGIKKRLEGIPALLVVDADGHLLNAEHVAALADARSMEPRAIVAWLARWAR